MLRLEWSADARRDVREIAGFISERNPQAAQRIVTAIEDTAERLPLFPYLYRVGRVHGTGEAVVHPNYILIYRVAADHIRIVSVVHARRRYPPA